MAGKRKNSKSLIADERIVNKIFMVRNQRVMLDRDLAEMYNVETRVLKQAVKRNIERFPSDFMFQLSLKEFEDLKSQIVTPSWGGKRKRPFIQREEE